MLEIIQNFEQMAARLNPIVLIAPGLTAVIVGLFVWLGGLGFRRLLVAVAGTVTGGICGFFIIGRNILTAIVLAALTAVIAIIFQRLFIALLTAALAALLALVVLAGLLTENPQSLLPENRSIISPQTPALDLHESIELAKTYLVELSDEFKQYCSQMPPYSWVIIPVSAAIFIVVGFYLWRLASSLCCAALGTTLIFAGMVLLLWYKGAAPVDAICRKPAYYGAVFGAMTAFGTVEQLLLCKRAKRKSERKKKAGKDKKEPDEEKQDWRTA